MADKVRKELHPDVVVYVFKPGRTSGSGVAEFNDSLSQDGYRESDQLGRAIAGAHIDFDHVICSAARRAQETMRAAARHFTVKNWRDCKNTEWARELIAEAIWTIPDIGLARRIAIFSYDSTSYDTSVVGDAEALFPQHAAILGTIELGSCGCIRLDKKTCQHFPLLY